eukprot:2185603-Ditylum_brightwellii.AAC.3
MVWYYIHSIVTELVSAAPREGHLTLAKRLFGYLKKYPKRGYAINPNPLKIVGEYKRVKVKLNSGTQYSYFREEINPRFPEPLFKEFDQNVFCDSDHGHDRKTGQLITGLFTFVGSTPVSLMSKQQVCVHTSTFGAEFTALLKKAVKEAVTLWYHLRSMGVRMSKPNPIYVNNMNVILNATDPDSTLNKKTVALLYHFFRSRQFSQKTTLPTLSPSCW